MQGGVNRWERPTGPMRSWRRSDKVSMTVISRSGVQEMDVGGRQVWAWPGWTAEGGRGWGCLGLAGGCQLAQDLWGLRPAGAGLWPGCS